MSMPNEELSREFDSATDEYLAEHDLIRLPVDNTGRAFHPGESIIHPQGTVMYIDDICFQLEDKEHQCTYTVPFSDMSEFVHDTIGRGPDMTRSFKNKKLATEYLKTNYEKVLRTLVKNNKLTKEAYKRITNEDYEQQYQSTLSELAEILVKQTDRVLDYIENPTQVPLIDVYNALNHIDFIAKNIANRAEKE